VVTEAKTIGFATRSSRGAFSFYARLQRPVILVFFVIIFIIIVIIIVTTIIWQKIHDIREWYFGV